MNVDPIEYRTDDISPLVQWRNDNDISLFSLAERLEDIAEIDASEAARLIRACEAGRVGPYDRVELDFFFDSIVGDQNPGLRQAQAEWFRSEGARGGME